MISWHATDRYSDGFVEWRLYDDNRQVGEVVCLHYDLGTYYAELSREFSPTPPYFPDVEKAKDYLWTLYALEKAA